MSRSEHLSVFARGSQVPGFWHLVVVCLFDKTYVSYSANEKVSCAYLDAD